MNTLDLLLLDQPVGTGGLGPQIPPIPRRPLGPLLQPVNYRVVLPFFPPAGRTLDFYRGNFCGLQIPDAPVVQGCNDRYPQTVMAALLDNYPEAFQHRYLQMYAEAGYTHLQRSIGHALYYGHDLAAYNHLSEVARSQYGLYCDHWLMGGGEGDAFFLKARAQTIEYWQPVLGPIINAIVGSGTMDLCCVGWQLDQFNQPGNVLIAIIAYIANTIPQSVPLYTHWMNEALAWWRTGGEVWTDQYGSINVIDRFTWWYAMRPYLTGGHHQGSNIMAITDPKQYQDRLLDTLDYFGGDTGKGTMGQSMRGGQQRPFALTDFEVTAQFQFDGLTSEAQGDESGYLALCTTSHTGLAMAGYGNGARYLNGFHV